MGEQGKFIINDSKDGQYFINKHGLSSNEVQIGERKMKLGMFIKIKLQVEGTHSWPECPIEEVKFLRSEHRHIFHIMCMKKVTHEDRDIEIIKFKREIKAHVEAMRDPELSFGRSSCETIAKAIMEKFGCVVVEVLEDNENGAYLIDEEL